MKARALAAIIISVIIFGTLLAQQKPATVEEIVARVNGDIILKSELTEAEHQLRAGLSQQLQGAQLEQTVAQQSKDLLGSLIDTTLLMQRAAEMGLNADLEIVKNMEKLRQEYKMASIEELEKAIVEQGLTVDDFKQQIRRQYLQQQVIGQEVYPKVIITNEEVRNYYDSHKQEFDKPAGLQVREILVSTEGKTPQELSQMKAKADEALAAIHAGDDFADVARKYSDAETAQNGGDLGFFEKGQMAKEWEDALQKIEKGQTTSILAMPYGFLILKLEDKHDGGILPFEIAREQVQNALWQQRVQPKIREYLTRLRGEGFVEVKDGYVDTGVAPAKVSETKSPN